LIRYFIFPIMVLGLISGGILHWRLHKFIARLPQKWKRLMSFRNFQRGVLFLTLFITSSLVTESVSQYLADQGIYNGFVFSIDFTVSTIFLFGFLFINTKKNWKKFIYFILYTIIVGYLINGGYYDRHCILPGDCSLIIFSIYFLVALLHLTDLLLAPKSTHFNFQLKINLSILIFSLVSVIITSFHWADAMELGPYYSNLILYIHMINICLFYLSLALIFISEILKLRHG
jgi:hypothetical protein